MCIRDSTKGIVRAWDVRTGKLQWTFHTIPKKGEPGYDTWLNGSACSGARAGSLPATSPGPTCACTGSSGILAR